MAVPRDGTRPGPGRSVVDRVAGPRRGSRHVSGPGWLAAVATGVATVLVVPGPTLLAPPAAMVKEQVERDWLRRWRPLWVLLSGAAAAAFLGGPVGLAAAPVAAV